MSTLSPAARANRTRQEWAAIATLRDGHFTGTPKDPVRDQVLDFLQPYTEDGAMGDLLGPGWSALAATERGIRVIAAEDCSWSGRVLGDRELAKRAALRMGADGGFEVRTASFGRIISDCTTANYDPCGPPSEKWDKDIRRMAEAGLRAFAATALLSRVDGMKGIGEKGYIRLAKMSLEDNAPAYRLVEVIEYRGESNLPMAVFLVAQKTCVAGRCVAPQYKSSLCRLHYPAHLEKGRRRNLTPEQLEARQEGDRRRKLTPEQYERKLERKRKWWRNRTPEQIDHRNERRRKLRQLKVAA